MREEILRLIENKARIDLADLAVMVGLPEAEVANEIAQMEKEGIICGYYTLINWEKTTEEKVDALIEVHVTTSHDLGFDKIAEWIYHFDEVKSCYLISGSYDFLLILEGKTMRQVSTFVSNKLSPIEYVTGTATHFILKRYKDYGAVLGEKKKDERERFSC